MKRLLLILTLLWCALPDGVQAEEPILIRFSHVVSPDDPKGLGAEWFKERVEQRLAGKVRVEIYPNSELFTDEQVFLALLAGDVQIATPSLSKFGAFAPQLQVFDLPFLFKDVEVAHRFQTSETGRRLLEAMRPKGIQGLAYWDNGLRVISANRALRSPQDAAGLKFRIEDSDVIEAQYRMLDALPVKLPFKQVYDALQSGLVDAQENSWSNIVSRRLYKLGQHFTETNHSYQGYMVVTSTKFWDGLPREVRAELEKILAEVTEEVNRTAREKAAASRKAVIESGADVIELSPVEKELWAGQWLQLRERFQDRIGKDIVEAAVAAGGE